jgi:hypothetical protein
MNRNVSPKTSSKLPCPHAAGLKAFEVAEYNIAFSNKLQVRFCFKPSI